MSGMTATERKELMGIVKFNAKVAKADAEARGKALLAVGEQKLAAIYKADDAAWRDITEAAERLAAEADARIAKICRERGVPEDFRPHLSASWYGRGENASNARRVELRRVLQTTVAAMVQQAQVEVDRETSSQLTAIARSGLTSEEARAFISNMPQPQQLLAPLRSLDLGDGTVVSLDSNATVQPLLGNASETDSRNICAFCGNALDGARQDAKYCKSACRVADHRRKKHSAGR